MATPSTNAAKKSTTPKASTSKTTLVLPVNAQKQLVAASMIKIVAQTLSAKAIPGVTKTDALSWAGEWMNYFPGVRQGKVAWDSRLGTISNAGKPAPKPATGKTSTAKKTVQAAKTATVKAKPAAKPASAKKTTVKPAARRPAATPAAMPARKPTTTGATTEVAAPAAA